MKEFIGKMILKDGEHFEVMSGPYEGDTTAPSDWWFWVSNSDGVLIDIDMEQIEEVLA